jgi:hypothetical protein
MQHFHRVATPTAWKPGDTQRAGGENAKADREKHIIYGSSGFCVLLILKDVDMWDNSFFHFEMIKGGTQACPQVFCTTDLAFEAMSMFAPITRAVESFSRFANRGAN